MAAGIVRFPIRARPLGREEAEKLRQEVRALAATSPDLVRELLAIIDRRAAASDAWRFVMVGPVEDAAVILWIIDNAKRLRVSLRLWTTFKLHMHSGTQEILMDRAAMVQAARATSAHVSEALAELVSIGALERHQEGRSVRWFINSKIATHLSGAAREEAQQAAPPLLAAMQDGEHSA